MEWEEKLANFWGNYEFWQQQKKEITKSKTFWERNIQTFCQIYPTKVYLLLLICI